MKAAGEELPIRQCYSISSTQGSSCKVSVGTRSESKQGLAGEDSVATVEVDCKATVVVK